MTKQRLYPKLTVTKKQTKRIHEGHPWIYRDEITTDTESVENGSIVDVYGLKDNYLGTGLYSRESKISVRLLTNDPNVKIDDAFYARRIKHAVRYRYETMKESFSCCRLVHGESDFLPGLTIDRYNDILVSEVTCYGIEQVKDVIYRALRETLASYDQKITAVYERNENPLRRKEGLELYKGWYEGTYSPLTIINEHDIQYYVDVENGQKTGFFLDQKENRLAVRRIAEGKKVLDCCCHTGSFAINAAYGNASSVVALDISATALETAKKNAALNHLEDKISFIEADVFDALENYRRTSCDFDFIILDPPAFTKSHKSQYNAYQGYKKINSLAMKLLKRGSYLATNSCSHFMPEAMFEKMLHEAAIEAGVKLRIVEKKFASCDHPVVIGVEETNYLKYYLLQIV